MLEHVVRYLANTERDQFTLSEIMDNFIIPDGETDSKLVADGVINAIGQLSQWKLVSATNLTSDDAGELSPTCIKLINGETSRMALKQLEETFLLGISCRKNVARKRGKCGRSAAEAQLQKMDNQFGQLFNSKNKTVKPPKCWREFFMYRLRKFMEKEPAEDALLKSWICGALYQKYIGEIEKWEFSQ